MKKITDFIPGFRSKKLWKMIIASIYYAFSIFMLFAGFSYGLFIFSVPFVVFYLVDIFNSRKKGIPFIKPVIPFISSLIVLIVSFSAIPSEPQTPAPEQNDPPARTAVTPAKDETSIPDNNEEEITKKSDAPITLEEAEITQYVDGDTVYVRLENNEEQKLRFIGIDTPETVHPDKEAESFGKEASEYTKSKLQGKKIYLEKDVSNTDRYGRLLRYVWLEPPALLSESEIRTKMFNADLVLNGYAQAATFPPDVKYSDYFVKFQDEARKNEKGLWANNTIIEEPVPPAPPTADQPEVSDGAISQTHLTGTVRQGQNAAITIQGQAGVEYKISVTYKSGASKAKGLEAKTAGNDGQVTWTWKVGINTTPGQYPITITGGGETFKTYFTVTE